MGIDFDLTIGSRSNFCTSIRSPFSLAFLWNRYPPTWRSHQPDLSNGSKWPKLSIRQLDRAQIIARVSGGCFPWGCYGMKTP